MTAVKISKYGPNHLSALICAAEKINKFDTVYPPANDDFVKLQNWTGWLFNEKTVARLVATSNTKVLGYIIPTPPHDYIEPHLETDVKYFEVGQFFVDPEMKKAGIGKKLLTECLSVAKSFDRKLALCVLEGSHDAQRFYRHNELHLKSSFVGRDGINLVFVEL